MKRRISALTALAAAAALALAGCSGTANPGGTATAGGNATSTVTVSSGGACICHAPLYVGIEKGYFKEHGIDVELRQLTQGFTAMGTLQTGDGDVADASVPVAAQASSQGIEAEGLLVGNGDPTGTVDTSEYFAIVARDGSGIEEGDLETLKGKSIGVAVGTVAHQYIYYTLQDAGLDPETDVTIQNVQPADLVSTLQSGSVDAIVGWEPAPLTALKNVAGSYIVQRGGNAMQYLFWRWAAPSFTADSQEDADAFVTAFIQAMQFARENPEETAEIVAAEFDGLPTETVTKALEYLNFDPRISQETLDAANQGLEFARSQGNLTSEYSLADHFDIDWYSKLLAANEELLSDLPEIPADLQLAG